MAEPIVNGEETLELARRRSDAKPLRILYGGIGIAVNQRRSVAATPRTSRRKNTAAPARYRDQNRAVEENATRLGCSQPPVPSWRTPEWARASFGAAGCCLPAGADCDPLSGELRAFSGAVPVDSSSSLDLSCCTAQAFG